MREYLPWMSYTTCSTLICRDDDTRISLVYLVSIFLEKCDDIRLRDRLEDIGATAWEERIYDGKTRILRRGTDEGDDAFFDPWEEDILLRLRPAMYLIEK